MSDLLLSRLDYIFFCYGLAFLLMAVSCFAMGARDRERLGWWLLGFFGLTHGINEWLDLVAFSLGDNEQFSAVRSAVLIVSFLFLMEFGRAGTRKAIGWGPGQWVLALFGAGAAAGAFHGLEGLNAASRYSLGLTGGLWAAAFLLAESKRPGEHGRGWLALAGVALGLYAFAAGIIVPRAAFSPADTINTASFLTLTGVPVQFVRGVLAVAAAVSVTAYSWALRRHEKDPGHSMLQPASALGPMVTVVMLVAGGWFMAGAVGEADKREFNENHAQWTRTLAGAVGPDLSGALPAEGGTLDENAYRRLRDHLRQIRLDNTGCQYAAIRKKVDGKILIVADGEDERSPAHHEYGYSTTEPQDDMTARYGSKAFAKYGQDGEGAPILRVYAPIFKETGGEMAAQLELIFDASTAERLAATDSLYAIALTGALCVLSIVAFIAWSRTKEALSQSAELRLASLSVENERKLRNIASALGEGVIVTDKEGRTAFMNPEAERLLGYSEAELLGKDAHDILHFQDIHGNPVHRENCPSMRSIAFGRTNATDDEAYTRKDGSSFPVSYISAPLYEHGAVSGVVIAFRDITRAKKATEALIKSEHSYRTLSENLPGIVYRIILGERNETLFFNEMVEPMTGYAAVELRGPSFCIAEKLALDVDRARILNAVNLAVMEGSPFQVEYRIRHKDGGIRHFLERGRPVRDNGETVCIDGVILDVTEERKADEELRKYKFMVEESGEEMYLIDSKGRYRYANRTACERLGYTLDELLGMGLEDIDPAYSGRKLAAHFEELRKKDIPVFETKHLTRDGRTVTKEVKSDLIKIGGEEYICGIARDITERKELDRQRSEFLSMVTHDLKSPLSVIQAYSEIMLADFGDKLPGDLPEIAKGIKSSSGKLLALVEDFLAVSRLEFGAKEPALATVDMDELVYEAGMAGKTLADKKGLAFETETSRAGFAVKADRALLSRAVANLVHNAVNYTPVGGTVRLAAYPVSMDGVGYAAITVTDNGPGIPPEEREKVFNKYYRSPGVSGAKGSGLGLAIVKAVAESHGGRVFLDAAEGGGCKFTLLVPKGGV
ncbi:MAG TPA: PAS domain-containing sensor histidine kinase [Nitrospirota bacterium]